MTDREKAKEFIVQSVKDNVDIAKVAEAIQILEQQSSEDCISREEAIRVAEQGQIQGYEWEFKKLCNLPSVTPSYKSIKTELEPSEDCISRAEALKAIEEEKLDWGNTGVEAIDGCLEAVGNLPSVTPSIPDVENDFNLGYNCGYADAMIDIAESEE
jgi:hypothetical protein